MAKDTIISSAFLRHKYLVEESMRQIVPDVDKAAKLIASTLKKGKKVLACGNGGSAADSTHFMEELVGRYKKNRQALAGISLSSDGAVLTVIGNDFGYEEVFARQVEALGSAGDALVAFTTSGSSQNVLKAIAAAQKKKMKIILFTGQKGSTFSRSVDVAIIVPSIETARVQEIHELAYHAICEHLDTVF